MSGFIWSLFSFIVALGILVFIHEFGHFWVARKNGIKVLRFAVGFGKPIYSWYDKQGTEYTIGLIPLGGYVRMLDTRVDEVEEKDLDVTFNNKKVTQRIAVVAAGPLANFVFAIFALLLMYLIGVPAVKPIVGQVEANSIAAEAGLLPVDEIVQVEDNKVVDWETTAFALLQQVGEDQITVTVRRDNLERQVKLITPDWTVDEGRVLAGLGITPYRPAATLTLQQIVEGSAAQKAGLQVNDTLVKMGETELTSWQDAVEIISNAPAQEIAVEILRDGQKITLNVRPDSRQTEDGFSQGYLGVAPVVENWPKGYVFEQQYAILPALQKSLERTWAITSLSFQMIGKLLTGDIGLNNLSGPISIAQGAGISAQSGIVYFLSFLALISVNLGVVNLLPLPVLDGGHLMYFFIELIRGKPVSERVQEMGFRIGAFVLMMIMGIAIINDFARL